MKYVCDENDNGRTILKVIERLYKGISKSLIYKAFRTKQIKINDVNIKDSKTKVKTNDVILVKNLVAKKVTIEKAKGEVEVVYEDDNILVVNKPTGVVMHSEPNSLDNQIYSYLKIRNYSTFLPSHIGRLDKVTSGIVLYAKNYSSYRILQDNMHNIKKTYEFKSDLDKPMKVNVRIMHDENKQRMVVTKTNEGKESITNFAFDGKRKIATIETGRKHQIRVTLSHLNFPIYGDKKYGGKPAKRVYLHCESLTFKNIPEPLDYLNSKELFTKVPWW
ncbi:MAG: RluA family pseudouridine synthase [Mycoplasma sp.]|nr:RluA family pseudouridine synthase [Mycoplasma sp.]